MTTRTEKTNEVVKHDVRQAYRINGKLIEFLPVENVPGWRYRIIFESELTGEWVRAKYKRPSKKLAVFFYEKIVNDRYVRV